MSYLQGIWSPFPVWRRGAKMVQLLKISGLCLAAQSESCEHLKGSAQTKITARSLCVTLQFVDWFIDFLLFFFPSSKLQTVMDWGGGGDGRKCLPFFYGLIEMNAIETRFPFHKWKHCFSLNWESLWATISTDTVKPVHFTAASTPIGSWRIRLCLEIDSPVQVSDCVSK